MQRIQHRRRTSIRRAVIEAVESRLLFAYPRITQLTGTANPLNGVDIGSFAAPAVADVDGDGDLDAVVGQNAGTLGYFKNTGNATSPVYVQQAGAANPFDAVNIGTFSSPTLGDIDGDGDLDLVIGAVDGTLRYFKNIGSATSPTYVQQTGAANPLNGFDVGDFSKPALADVDGEGDLDLVVGGFDGALRYFRNTGGPSNPVYVQQSPVNNPFNAIDVGDFAAPALGDVDADGDLDLVAGGFDGTLRYYQNLGNANIPFFAQQTGSANPFNGFNLGADAVPALGNLDGDGDLDALVGNNPGTLQYFRNGVVPATVNYLQQSGAANPFNSFDFGDYSTPEMADFDSDGDPDAIVGNSELPLYALTNTGNATNPAYSITGTSQIVEYATPALGDVDGDGDPDMVQGNFFGNLGYFKNTGSASNAVFTLQGNANNPFAGVMVSDYSTPELGDVDSDGDLDLVVGAGDGTLQYHKNIGSATSPVYVLQNGGANPFSGITVGDSSTPELGDVDGDGDLDLVMGEPDGTIGYFRNTGSAISPAYVQQTGSANPFNGVDVSDYSTPALADVDGDGDLDLVAGESFGKLFYYRANRAPVVDNAIPDQVFSGGGVKSYTVPADTFRELEGNAITYTATQTNGDPLPAWLSFNPTTRTFSGNPGALDTSPLQLRVIADDGNGGVGFDDFQLTLTNVADNSLVVNTLVDENNGNADPAFGAGTSLREAINYAQSLSGSQLVTFDSSLTSGGPATISLAQGELVITGGNFRVQGPSASLLTITAHNASRVFNVSGGGTIELTAMTITGGAASSGAGILNSASNLVLIGVTVANNAASSFGGGIASPNGGQLIFTSSSIVNNTAGNEAGGIESQGTAGLAASVQLNNCTIAGNTANGSGFGGAISNVASGGSATITLRDCTVANNSGANGAGIINAVNSGSATTTYIGTILANNGANVVNFGGTLVSSGHNLSTDGTGNLTGVGDLPNTNAQLGTLGMNGGATPTIPLLPNSPAINAGVEIQGITRDQRAVLRPQGLGIDIGAYERQATNASLTSMSYEWDTRQAVTFNFSGDASVTFGRPSYTLENLTTAQTIAPSVGSFIFNSAGTQATLVLTNLLANGDYRLTSGSSTLDFFVLKGDANHDRKVNFDDYVRIDLGFHNHSTGYSNGDFNYDGVVNFDDYVIIDVAFNTSPTLGRAGNVASRGGRVSR